MILSRITTEKYRANGDLIHRDDRFMEPLLSLRENKNFISSVGNDLSVRQPLILVLYILEIIAFIFFIDL